MGVKNGRLVLFGVGAVLVLLSLVLTPTYTSDYGLIIQMNTTEPEWQTVGEETIPFESNAISRLLTTYKVKISYSYEFDLEEGRVTTLTYRVYHNSVFLDEIRYSYDIGSGSGGGRYDLIPLPVKLIDAGENIVRIHISFNSIATEPRTKDDSFEFHIDSVVITDNYRLTVLILFTFTSIVMIHRYWGSGG